MNAKWLTFFLVLLPGIGCMAQSRREAFRDLECPEKRWVITHLFVAGKALKVSQRARFLADSLDKAGALDGDPAGGRLDAFRHGIWMALLCQKMNWHKAKRLGIAHEKANYIQFKKGMSEDETIPDKVAGEMDLYNNEKGLLIGRENKRSREERVVELILWMIADGQMKIISKDRFGKSLDANGNLISDEKWMGHWDTERCLVKSDSLRK